MNQELPVTGHADGFEEAEDICSLPLARRMAALLNQPADKLREGKALPRGWHVMMFNPPTAQELLRPDGAAHLGFKMPDLGLPRLMLGGRKIAFEGDIPIGAPVLRRSRLGVARMKEGRSGPFALIDVEHELSLGKEGQKVVTETNSYILLPEENGSNRAGSQAQSNAKPDLPDGALIREFTPDEPMLFRYSAITDNPHRIHYDHPYATGVEGYPALVVNGSLPQMLLLDMFRQHAGREPVAYESRNKAPIYCGSTVTLCVSEQGDQHGLAAYNEAGEIAIEGQAW